WRMGIQFIGVAKLPPANCGPYFAMSVSPWTMRTCDQSASSSSAISIGSIVLMPWPISGFLPTIVMMLSGEIVTKALSEAPSAMPVAAPAAKGIVAVSASPPPASTPALRTARRDISMVAVSGIGRSIGTGRGHGDCLLDPAITRAAADIAVHCRIDLPVVGIGIAGEQGTGGHQLTRLAVAALHHILFQPGFLESAADLSLFESLHCADLGLADRTDRQRT